MVTDSDGNNNDHGNVIMHGLWKRGEEEVLDKQVVDCDAPSPGSPIWTLKNP